MKMYASRFGNTYEVVQVSPERMKQINIQLRNQKMSPCLVGMPVIWADLGGCEGAYDVWPIPADDVTIAFSHDS